MIYYDIPQNTDEWLRLRMGRFTASTFKDIMGKDTAAGYTNAIYKVAFERISNELPENFTNEWMERGKELEPQARLWYELNHTDTSNGGFFCDDWTGASPDALVGEDGLLEIKCPKYSTHIQYLLDGALPSTYKWQVQGQLYVTDRKWCDFMSYHPKVKAVYNTSKEKRETNRRTKKIFRNSNFKNRRNHRGDKMSDKIFPDGLIFKLPGDKAPDFVKGKLSINLPKFAQWIKDHKDGEWMNFDLSV